MLAAGGCSSHSLGKGDYANPIDEIGRYHDVVFNSGTLYVSAYDDTMGDLVYTEIKDPTKNPSWQVIDGVDQDRLTRRQGRLSLRHQRSRPRRRPVHLDRAWRRASR